MDCERLRSRHTLLNAFIAVSENRFNKDFYLINSMTEATLACESQCNRPTANNQCRMITIFSSYYLAQLCLSRCMPSRNHHQILILHGKEVNPRTERGQP